MQIDKITLRMLCLVLQYHTGYTPSGAEVRLQMLVKLSLGFGLPAIVIFLNSCSPTVNVFVIDCNVHIIILR